MRILSIVSVYSLCLNFRSHWSLVLSVQIASVAQRSFINRFSWLYILTCLLRPAGHGAILCAEYGISYGVSGCIAYVELESRTVIVQLSYQIVFAKMLSYQFVFTKMLSYQIVFTLWSLPVMMSLVIWLVCWSVGMHRLCCRSPRCVFLVVGMSSLCSDLGR